MRRSLKEVPVDSDVSRAIAKDLRARGGNFVGPTIVYAFMQATGMVNDHLVDCCRHEACRRAGARAPAMSETRRAAPGSGCCRDGGSTSSILRRSTSRSATSPMGLRAWLAGTVRRRGLRSSPSRNIRCWWRRCSRPAASLLREARLAALLHDAPEYVIGDMISPFKAAVGGDYKLVEARLKRAVLIRFGLTAEPPDDLERRIKIADRASAYLEATALAGFSIAEARKLFGEPDLPISDFAAYLEPMRPADVEARFLARFAELDAEAAGTL